MKNAKKSITIAIVDSKAEQWLVENLQNGQNRFQVLTNADCFESLTNFLRLNARFPNVVIWNVQSGETMEPLSKFQRNFPKLKIIITIDLNYLSIQGANLTSITKCMLLKNEPTAVWHWTINELLNGKAFFSPEIISLILQQTKKDQSDIPFTNNLSILARGFTPQETAIAKALLTDKSYAEISSLMNLNINTVKHYVRRIYRNLLVQKRSQLKSHFNMTV